MRTFSRWTRGWGVGIALATAATAGCGLLDVQDPTTIQDDAVQNSDGAELLRLYALRQLSTSVSQAAYSSGMMSDEFFFDIPSWMTPLTSQDEFLDRRDNVKLNEMPGLGYSNVAALRVAVNFALPQITRFSAKEHAGELYAVRGLGTLTLAEDFCSGFPINNTVDERVVLSGPLTTEDALESALVDFDSAAGLTADSAQYQRLARVGRGRALLGLGRFAEAAAAVSGVPTEYTYSAEFNTGAQRSILGADDFRWSTPLASVSDREGGNGLDFSSANDPRVVVVPNGTSTDGVTPLYKIGKYPSSGSWIVLASGVEARLIEAEAALQANDPSWLQILKDLRTWSGAPAGLQPLTDDPVSQIDKENLLFRERAFWLFATGRRLGDLRRLVRTYGRPAASVYPAGAYRLGGQFAAGISVPFEIKSESSYNPAVTGCLDQ